MISLAHISLIENYLGCVVILRSSVMQSAVTQHQDSGHLITSQRLLEEGIENRKRQSHPQLRSYERDQ